MRVDRGAQLADSGRRRSEQRLSVRSASRSPKDDEGQALQPARPLACVSAPLRQPWHRRRSTAQRDPAPVDAQLAAKAPPDSTHTTCLAAAKAPSQRGPSGAERSEIMITCPSPATLSVPTRACSAHIYPFLSRHSAIARPTLPYPA